MTQTGSASNPLRVAIIGAGPTGFYAADHLLKQKDWVVQIDMYDRLPTPFGLVRGGVAPDHQKIKSVTRVFHKVATQPNFRFFGNVEFGKHVMLSDLQQHYHQILYTTGAQTDRNLGVPGEDLNRSHSATEFVAWYNGHPDYTNLTFDLSQESVAIVGVGNVAIDVARILARTPEELARTDIADYALEALRASRIKEIYVLGRRGPAQAAFTTPEVKELGELEDADVVTLPEEVDLDPLSLAELSENPDKNVMKKVEVLQESARRPLSGKTKKLVLRFLVSPVEITGDEAGGVAGMRLVKNELYATKDGQLRPRATENYEDLPIGLVFRSVGYQGVPIAGIPFNERWAVIANEKGRVVDPETGQALPGQYTAGWIKRGPTGVIGTNKPCAVETVDCMLEDLSQGKILYPSMLDAQSIEQMIRQRQPDYFTYEDWQRLDELEIARGKELGRPRVKLTSVEDMRHALERELR